MQYKKIYTYRRTGRKRKLKLRCILIVIAAIAITGVTINLLPSSSSVGVFTAPPIAELIPPEEVLLQYFAHIEYGRFDDMYDMLTQVSRKSVPREDFVQRHRNIYGAIGARNIAVTVNEVRTLPERPGRRFAYYSLRMDSIAGEISHDGQAVFELDSNSVYRLQWNSCMIFPNLGHNDRVRINILPAKRGNIYDRNGRMLAGPGPASQVGLVPGRLAEDPEEYIARLAELLEITPERVHQRLGASYVRDDTFVLIRTISSYAQELIDELLTIPGVLINSTTVRFYPWGRNAAHLVGYIQNINAEELEELRDEGYHANSVIGRAGLERILENELRARDGREIIIVNSEGRRTATIARKLPVDGNSVHLHICARIQMRLYQQFATDRGASVAMNPRTGEVLALVSTPSYDPNYFVRGMTTNMWNSLMEDENLPMFNRFRATFSPGSTMKAITAAIGIDEGIFTYYEDFGPSGRRWQQDKNWGRFFVTTVTQYSGPANLNNAMAWSDNIYFAKATLRMGADTFISGLENFGFGRQMPFEYGMFSSTISRSGEITSDIMLADSGYGQGEILVNPLHLAVAYSAFVNEGSIIRPRLISRAHQSPEFWLENVFSPQTAEIILDSLIYSVEVGTGRLARQPDMVLAGKTGTAELKLTQADDGIELGWFVLMTADEDEEHPLLVVSMVEGVQNRGGSGYVVPKVASIFPYAELTRMPPIYLGFGRWTNIDYFYVPQDTR